MKFLNFFRVFILAISLAVFSGCSETKEKTLSSGINLADFDNTVALGDDFYQYASGGWLKNNPLRETDMDRDAFAIVTDSVNDRLKRIITHLSLTTHRPGSVEQKISDFYTLAMDSVKLNSEGCEPLKPLYNKIGAITSKDELIPMIVEIGRKTPATTYFNYGSIADMENSQMIIMAITQGGLGLLGQKEYYLSQDPSAVYIRNQYKEYIVELFKLVGLSDNEAANKADDVIELETSIAQASFSSLELRDLQANYHKMSVEELKSTVPDFNWDLFFKEIGLSQTPDLEIDLRQIEPMKNIARICQNTPISKHIAYMQFHLVNQSSPYLSDAFSDARFNFYGKIFLGMEQQSPRWNRAINNINDLLGESVGQLYVKQYFPAASKERIIKLVNNLQETLAERLKAQSWMSDSTKVKALDKLNMFQIKIGYPDKWTDYSSLDIKKDSYWSNVSRVNAWDFDNDINKIGKIADKEEWDYTPQSVNAAYNPQNNSICFPAAILQPPFFDMDADDAYNYGAIGSVIGHEMTHGFDDQGRHFDKNGNMTEWWSSQDVEEFNKRVQVLVDYFNNIEVLPEVYLDGELTLGENIADHGGIEISFQAFQNAMKKNPLPNKDGFTPEQRFFISYARLWASNIREEFIHYSIQNDVHTINKWRVNGALPHIKSWYEAFDITPKDSMYIKPEDRADIW